MGDEHMWHGPVTSCAWFNDYGKPQRRNTHAPILPTAEKNPGLRSATLAAPAPVVGAGVPHRHHRSKGRSSHRDRAAGGQHRSKRHQQRDSGESSLIGGSSISSHEFDNGKIRNPNDERRARR